MYAQVDKSKESKSSAVANSITHEKKSVKQGLGFDDNRSETVFQKKLKENIHGKELADVPILARPLITQFALDPVTGTVPVAEHNLAGFLNAHGINIETEISEDKTIFFKNRLAQILIKNSRLKRGVNIPLKNELQEAYDDLVVDSTNHKTEFLLNDWHVKNPPYQANNRTEMDLTTKYNSNYYGTYNINVSNRHDAQSYLVPPDSDTLGSNEQNTIVYSGTNDFEEGFRNFGDNMALAMNARGGKYRDYDATTLPVYVPARGPLFESDRGGKNVHSYPVATPNTSITLTNAEHVTMKLILRGGFAPKEHRRFAEAKRQWPNRTDNVNMIFQGMNLIHILQNFLDD